MNPKSLIEQYWGKIFEQNGFVFARDSPDYAPRYKSSNCHLDFDLSEPGYPTIAFKDPGDQDATEYAWDQVMKFAGPEQEVPYPAMEGDADDYSLESLAHHLKIQAVQTAEYLGQVLKGDFSFAKSYREDDEGFRADMNKLLTLPVDHPAKVAWLNEEPGWRGLLD